MSLPPVTAFGVPGAYYSVEGYASSSTTSVKVSASAFKPRIAPGHHVMPLLPEPVLPYYYSGSEAKNQPLTLPFESPVNGANAYTADMTNLPTAGPVERVWRVISLGAGTESLAVPILPTELRSTYGLTAGTDYGVLIRANLNPMKPDGDQASTVGTVASITYNKTQSSLWRVRPQALER